MANYIFDGSANLSIPNFDPAADAVFFTEVDAADIASVTQTSSSVSVTLTNGTVVTLGNVIFASLTPNSLQAGPGSDLVFAIGTPGDDNPLNGNVVLGLAGNDQINATASGTANFDGALVFGNQGDDTINADGANVRLYGGAGVDQITLANSDADSNSLIVGGLGADSIRVEGTTSIFTDGNFTIYGGNEAGDPTDEADQISVALGDGSVLIYGNGGGDIIAVQGESGPVAGFSGEATIFGGQGDDNIQSFVNIGTIYGGLGSDQIQGVAVGEGSSVTVFGGNEAGSADDAADILNVTAVQGATATVYGNGGNDTINIQSDGFASLFGGAGDDRIGNTSGSGSSAVTNAGTVGDGSIVYGGLGGDTINLEVAEGTGSITVYGGNGQGDAADGNDTISVALTNIGSGTGATTQTASIFGNAGNDTINVSGSGTATVYGGQGNDTINVGGGNGAHVLVGGVGNDTFNFVNAGDTTDEANIVSVTDFAFGQDTIVFAATNAVSSVATVNIATAADIADLFAASSTTSGQASVVTVAGGDLAGTYAVYDGQAIEITGYSGSVAASSFSVGTPAPVVPPIFPPFFPPELV